MNRSWNQIWMWCEQSGDWNRGCLQCSTLVSGKLFVKEKEHETGQEKNKKIVQETRKNRETKTAEVHFL